MTIIQSALNFIKDNETLLFWLAGISFITLIGTLITIPLIVMRIPCNYFAKDNRHNLKWGEHHPIVRIILILAKNILGLIFIIAGIAMLLLPGQGLITIFIGIMLMDFPGKFKLEKKIISYPTIYKTINWLRRKSGCPSLQV